MGRALIHAFGQRLAIFKEHQMIQQDAFFGVSGKVRAACDCGMCAPNNIDWTKLTNTEKMVKAMILKAQITAEIQDAVK